MNAPLHPAPIYDIQVEQALLGSMLADPHARAQALGLCKAEIFYERLHGRIFDTLAEFNGADVTATDAAIKERMRGDPSLADIRSAGVPDYFRILKSMATPDPPIAGMVASISVAAERRKALHGLGYRDDAAEPRKFTVRCAGDISTAATREYLIKGLISPGDLSVWFGEPACGKSFAVLHASYALSQGVSVFGRRVCGAPVLYHCLEGETGFERRLQAIMRHRGPTLDFHFIAEGADFFGQPEDVTALISAIGETGARLVVIDTLARSMGAGSENDGRDMNQIIGAFDTIRRSTGAHVAIVHHSGKDSTRGMRGHSSLLAAADVAIEIKRDEDGTRSLRVVKAKDDQDGDIQTFMLDVAELGVDQDGEPITSCVVRETGAPAKTAKTVSLTQTEVGWLKDLQAIFADHDGGKSVAPALGITRQLCVTRDDAREGFKKRGRFELGPNGILTVADRQRISTALNNLKTKGKIGLSAEYVWLLHAR